MVVNAVAAEACTATGRRTVALADGLVADTAVPLIVVFAEIACILYGMSNKILLIINGRISCPVIAKNRHGWRGYDPSYPRSNGMLPVGRGYTRVRTRPVQVDR